MSDIFVRRLSAAVYKCRSHSYKQNVKPKNMMLKIVAGACLAFLATVFVFWQNEHSSLDKKDSYMNLMSAYNIFESGTFSSINPDQSTVYPDMYREPLFPFLLSLGISVLPKPQTFNATCLGEGPDCKFLRDGLRLINGVFWFGICFFVFCFFSIILGSSFSGGLFILLFSLFPVFEIDRFTTELAAGFFLTLHSMALYFCGGDIKNGRIKLSLIAGSFFTLGLLVLVKAVFYYWLIILSGLYFLWIICTYFNRNPRRLRWGKALIPLFLGWVTVGGWQLRNYNLFGALSVSDRGGVVLALRAEFLHATPGEIGAAFAHFFPSRPKTIKKSLMRAIDSKDLLMIDRKNPESYYQRVKGKQKVYIEQEMQIGHRISYNDEFQSNARNMILSSPIKHLGLSVLFAWRGSFLTPKPGEKLLKLSGYKSLREAYSWFLLFLVPAFLFTFMKKLWRQEWAETLFLMPALFSFSIHAIATHYIPRYSEPLYPIWLITFVLGLLTVYHQAARRVTLIASQRK